ncbi:MAG: BRO family protein [Tenuifilaceae bacterium]|nr:BRO family protein [Tenuifilaceae bacterium]
MLEIFKYENKEIRTIVKDGEPWFVANDIAEILGYVDAKQAVRDHCKCAKLLKGVDSTPLTTSPRGITIIQERDVYRLVLRSKLPSAEKFEDWVVSEVLPSIKKTGVYSVRQYNIPKTYAEALKLAYEQQLQIEAKDTLLLEQKPKVEAYNVFLDMDDGITIGDFAKIIHSETKLGRNNLFKKLRDMNILSRDNIPHQRYVAMNLFKIKEHIIDIPDKQIIKSQTYITPKGMDYIRIKLTE